jgi:hypothetical protein
MQREIAELNRLKQNKNRKYSWPGQLVVYSQPIEVTLYLIGCYLLFTIQSLYTPWSLQKFNGKSYLEGRCRLKLMLIVK